MIRVAAISFVVLLTACSVRHEGVGRACVLPIEMECGVDNGDSDSDTGSPFQYCEPIYDCVCTGYYPANQAFEVGAIISNGGGGYTSKEKCNVELTGDHQLSVTASYRQKPMIDDIYLPPVDVTCMTPTLAAGDWTLRYGEGEATFRVGTDELEAFACAYANGQEP